jgi:hypothetical protein
MPPDPAPPVCKGESSRRRVGLRHSARRSRICPGRIILLKKLDLGGQDSKLRAAGEVIFEALGGAPGNSYHWVELKGDVTVSLLQPRLIEVNLPNNVKDGTLS